MRRDKLGDREVVLTEVCRWLACCRRSGWNKWMSACIVPGKETSTPSPLSLSPPLSLSLSLSVFYDHSAGDMCFVNQKAVKTHHFLSLIIVFGRETAQREDYEPTVSYVIYTKSHINLSIYRRVQYECVDNIWMFHYEMCANAFYCIGDLTCEYLWRAYCMSL